MTAVTSESIGAVVSVSELVEEFKESSVPPLHEVIVRLTKKIDEEILTLHSVLPVPVDSFDDPFDQSHF